MIRASTHCSLGLSFPSATSLSPRPASAFVENPGKASHNSEGSFLWLAMWSGSLPVGSRLRDAGLSDGACPLCGWLQWLPPLRRSGYGGRLAWTCGLFSISQLFCFAAFGPLGLWRRRNTWVHERLPPAAAAPPHWRPPHVGSVKVNVDGALLPSGRLGAIGVIARDSSGAVLGGFAKPIPIQGPASTVEVAALFAGLEFAVANSWPRPLLSLMPLSWLTSFIGPLQISPCSGTCLPRPVPCLLLMPPAPSHHKEGQRIVKVEDLKPKRIKDYLEYKFSQRSPALLKELNSRNEVNTVHVRDQKHELAPPRNRYPCDNEYKEVTVLPLRDIVYDQVKQLIRLRHKPITLQDALPRSDSSRDFLPRQDPLSLFETSPLSSC
ncbi:hypothetical protein GQ457_11G026360 [Hibiscus cannabinus]